MKLSLIYSLLWTIIIISSPFFVLAQPANDLCETAIPIQDLNNYCSEQGAFSNDNATATNFEDGGNLSVNGKDVWFRFTAVASHITIGIVGRSDGGTLRRPEVELFVDNQCGLTFNTIKSEAGSSSNVVELSKGGLIPGGSYLFRVQGQDGREGSFQLCVNNFFPPATAGSDLEVAAMLCDKSSFVIEKIEGGGLDDNEAAGTCLDSGGGGVFGNIFGSASEQSSTWLTWIAANDGTLAFTLFPINPSDDLDFVLFELPNGVDSSDDKIALRCMATACLGPTGLDVNSSDFEEDFNCDPGEDGFVKAIDMKEGVAYGLLVNNFSESGNGFTVEFSGTGEFQGPKPQIDAFVNGQLIQTESICAGEQVSFDGSNSSFQSGDIIAYEWIFGVGADPATSDKANPGIIRYNEPGTKTVALTLTTSLGCKISEVREAVITVDPCCDLNTIEGMENITNLNCGEQNGAISFTAISASPIISYEWDNGLSTADLSDISAGDYNLTVTNAATCTASFDFQVTSQADFLINPIVTQPNCEDAESGIIQITTTTEVATQIQWSGNLGTGAQKTDLSAGEYQVTVTDDNGCSKTAEIILDPPTTLTVSLVASGVSCFGAADATIVVNSSGNRGAISYLWNTNSTSDKLENIGPGSYSVTVVDESDCEIISTINIETPSELSLSIDQVNDVLCNRMPTGSVIVSGVGGSPIYEYSVDATTFQAEEELSGLSAGPHTITVRDQMGCTATESIFLEDAEVIELSLSASAEALDLGKTTILDAEVIAPTAGNITYEWSPVAYLSCIDCAKPIATPISHTTFQVTVTSENNCTATAQINIRVDSNREVYVPTAFSPDGDGRHEGFTIMGGDAAERIIELKVFDRWGSLVFETINIPLGAENLGWDGRFNGRMVQSDVFVYYAIVQFRDGVTEQFVGDVLVLR